MAAQDDADALRRDPLSGIGPVVSWAHLAGSGMPGLSRLAAL
ncbi:MAG: hypothetical protein WDA23_09745 [Gemmobacter sp.]